MITIRSVRALEILDSRGNPTLQVTVALSDGSVGKAHTPAGASTGRYEAVELRDGDTRRYRGKGVRRAIENVEHVLGPALEGTAAEDQGAADRRLIELDGTADRSRLGANAILGVSCALARAVASLRRIPLWKSLASGHAPAIPTPMVNIISGGVHAGRRIEIQDFLVVPYGFKSFRDCLEAVVAVHYCTREVLETKGYELTGVADEGGWGPSLPTNETALQVLTEAIARAGFTDRFTIAIDVASSHFYASGTYGLRSERRELSREQMIDMLTKWAGKYVLTSIEDGLAEDDWEGWAALTERLGAKVQLIGDDLFATNPARLRRGIDMKVANAVLVKMNQIGTLTETFDVLRIARDAGYHVVISARSGETEDSFLADLAVASGAGQIKIGSVTRSERLAKYNRLLEIEEMEFESGAS